MRLPMILRIAYLLHDPGINLSLELFDVDCHIIQLLNREGEVGGCQEAKAF